MLELTNLPAIGPRLRLAPGVEAGDGLVHAAYPPVSGREAMLDELFLQEAEQPTTMRPWLEPGPVRALVPPRSNRPTA